MIHYLGYAHHGLFEKAKALAQRFSFELSCQHYPRLELQDHGLFYYASAKEKLGMDWNDLKWIKRSHGAMGQDPLIRACLAKKNSPLILDLTAGWGKDAMLLARAGARVILLEKNPVMAALLEDAHTRLSDDEIKARMQIHWIDAHDYLKELTPTDFPDIIYFDPMHPLRQKQALVKKHLQVLQTLVAPNEDVARLILLARQKCKERLVLKWPVKGTKFPDCKGSIIGKTIRFDLF